MESLDHLLLKITNNIAQFKSWTTYLISLITFEVLSHRCGGSRGSLVGCGGSRGSPVGVWGSHGSRVRCEVSRGSHVGVWGS